MKTLTNIWKAITSLTLFEFFVMLILLDVLGWPFKELGKWIARKSFGGL